MKNIPTRLALIIFSIILLCAYIWMDTKPASHSGKSRNKDEIVATIQPTIKPMPLRLNEVGTVEAEESVNIIPQVTGVLKKVDFQQGQNVQQGQLLFEIDPGIYATGVEQAKANLLRDQAQQAVAHANSDRYQALAKLEYVTQQQADEAKASSQAEDATVAADAAQLKQMQIQLGYTQIRAPITGKTSTINVHPGDLLTANSTTPLLVINRMDPVYANFTISQDQLLDVLRYQRLGSLAVEILNENGAKLLAKGELATINNNVNNQTGTVDLKATIPNANLSLWPGQLVTVSLILTVQPNAIVIPNAAVQMNQQGQYVYVVKNGIAVMQPITVSRVVDHEAVISQGLTGREIIISEIPPELKEGDKVLTTSPQTTSAISQRK